MSVAAVSAQKKTKKATAAGVPVPFGRARIALRLLVKSLTRNVRKTKTSPESIRELADQIKAQNGLLQNLVVFAQVDQGGSFTGFYEVSAGERRLCGLWLLRDDDKWLTDDYEVDVLVIPEAQAIAASWAENAARVPMHPADEFEAFKLMIEDGHAVEDVAARFGVSPSVVRRRLKLASVSPTLIDLFRAGHTDMDLSMLMAFTLVDDHEQQVKVWEGLSSYQRSAENVKNILMNDKLPTTNKLVRFVGLEAYQAAGGVFIADLFEEDQAGYVESIALLNQLAADKLDTMADAVRAEGWAWVEVNPKMQSHEVHNFAHAPSKKRGLDDAGKTQLKTLTDEAQDLDAKISAAYDQDEDGEDALTVEQIESLEERKEVVDAEIQAIEDARFFWTAKVMQTAGSVVSITRDGEAKIYRGLVKKADQRLAQAAAQQAAMPGEDEGEGGEAGNAGTLTGAKLSDALHRRLTAQHTMAVQLAVAKNVPVALAVLAESMVKRVFDGFGYGHTGMGISLTMQEGELSKADPTVIESTAFRELMEMKARWAQRVPNTESHQDNGEVFAWVSSLDQCEIIELIALCSALTINLVGDRQVNANTAKMAQATSLDMTDWWVPTAANYLGAVSKDLILAAVQEGAGHEACQGLSNLKKGDMASKAEELLAGKRWLPAVLKV